MTSQPLRQSGVEAGAKRFGKITVSTTRDPDGTIRLRTNEPLPEYPDRVQDHLFHWAKTTPSRRFLAERAAMLKATAESDAWRRYLQVSAPA